MRGRKPTPLEQRKREGTVVPSRHGKGVVQIGGRNAPEAPTDLTKDEKKCWDYLVTDLVESGTIDHIDAGIVEGAAITWARARQARRHIKKKGLVIAGKTGSVTNPAVRIEREAWSSFRQISEQLGLSPSARARLGIASVRKRTMQQELTDKIGPSPRGLRAVKEG